MSPSEWPQEGVIAESALGLTLTLWIAVVWRLGYSLAAEDGVSLFGRQGEAGHNDHRAHGCSQHHATLMDCLPVATSRFDWLICGW